MAGILEPSEIIYKNPDTNPGLSFSSPQIFPQDTLDYGAIGSGTASSGYPYSFPTKNFSGSRALTYDDDFYNKIRYFTAPLDLGNVVNTQYVTFYVFNGFMQSITLTSTTLNNGDGIGISSPTEPTLYVPLQLETFNFTISNQGPTNINATLDFDWAAPALDYSLIITGSRAVAFPWIFTVPVTEVLEWNTNILTAHDGSEQRISSRNKPHQYFNIDCKLPNDQVALSDILLYGWRGQFWAIPHWGEAKNSTNSVTTSDSTINVDTTYADYRVGSLAIVWESPTKNDVFVIDSFNDTSITAGRNFLDDFSSGAYVAPVRLGIMTGNPTRRTTGHSVSIQADFHIRDNVLLSEAPPTQYLGLDVLTTEPLLIDQNAMDVYQQRVDIIDYNLGSFTTFSPWLYTKISRQFQFLLEGSQEIWEFKEWLHRRFGRRVPFWMPTFENNLKKKQTGTILESLLVYDNDLVSQASSRTHIAIKTSSGWLFRQITYAQTGSDVTISFDTDLNIDASEIDFISFMGQKRLNSDRIELSWIGNTVVKVVLPIIEVSP